MNVGLFKERPLTPTVTVCEHARVVAGPLDLTGKDSSQISTDVRESADAIDGDPGTWSCTLDIEGRPWWAVDLAAVYHVLSVNVTAPGHAGKSPNCRHFCPPGMLAERVACFACVFFFL